METLIHNEKSLRVEKLILERRWNNPDADLDDLLSHEDYNPKMRCDVCLRRVLAIARFDNDEVICADCLERAVMFLREAIVQVNAGRAVEVLNDPQ